MSLPATQSPYAQPKESQRLGSAVNTDGGVGRVPAVHRPRIGGEWLALVGFTDGGRRMGLLTPFGSRQSRHEHRADAAACRAGVPETFL